MTIGLDIDDTITNSSELIMENAKRYFKSDDNDVINNILQAKTIEEKLFDFYYEYLPEMMANYDLKDNVKEVIDRLRAKGCRIIVITARGYTVQRGLIEVTEEYFNKHQIIVDKLIFKTIEKSGTCIEHKVDIMIDD